VADGRGDVSVSSHPNYWFFRPDGSGSAMVTSGRAEMILSIAPRWSGFVAISHTHYESDCSFARLLDPDATAPLAVASPALKMLAPNPAGGFVAAAYINDDYISVWFKGLKPTLVLRWLDDSLQPLGDWYAVTSWFARTNHHWRLVVDQQGQAIVLSFIYPQTLGGKPPPSTWEFSARWMGIDGPLTDAFQPMVPIFKPEAPDRPVLFGTFGIIDPLLPYGGFALFEAQAPPGSGGTISPTGWYAAYRSGDSQIVSAPDWLQPYNGSLYPLAGGKGYLATRRDPGTCRRTVSLIAPSGRACFELPLEGSNLCETWADTPWPDGTLVLETLDEVHWWPGLGRPAH
jgi:hypothetical protein